VIDDLRDDLLLRDAIAECAIADPDRLDVSRYVTHGHANSASFQRPHARAPAIVSYL